MSWIVRMGSAAQKPMSSVVPYWMSPRRPPLASHTVKQQDRLITLQATVLPSTHVLDDLRYDLVLSQVQGKDCFLPGDLGPILSMVEKLSASGG